MNHPATPNPLNSGRMVFTALRIFLTLLPAVILLTGISVASQLGDLWAFAIVPIPFLVLGIGYFDGRVSLRQQQIDPSKEKRQLIRWAFLFFLLQILIAPMFGSAIFFGFSGIVKFWKL